MKVKYRLFIFILFISFKLFSQEESKKLDLGQIHGNFEVTAQYYQKDSLIGAPEVDEKMLMNAFMNVNYVRDNLSAGVRYESYLNPLLGFDTRYEGQGIPYRYVSYDLDNIQVTAGNFYEQFGSGLIFRSYEARGLGIDNVMDGIRVKYMPFKGFYLKAVYGKQRKFWDKGPGIVRGIDGEIVLNEYFLFLDSTSTNLSIGGSFVSKYQKDQDPIYNLPENVGAMVGRINFSHKKFALMGEYAYKINDPSGDNGHIYKPGQAAWASASYSTKGFGVVISGKAVDNMSFRSDRGESLNNLMINYLPATTKQHTYNLAATLYPYTTQPLGEIGFQGDIIYTIPKGTTLGGKYGTTVNLNYSEAYGIEKTTYASLGESDSMRMGYTSKLLNPDNTVYFKDFNVEFSRKLNKKWKAKAAYFYFEFNNDVMKLAGSKGTFYPHIVVADVQYNFLSKHSLRLELQNMFVKQDNGNWGTGLIEYTYSPHWFVAVMDQYNYGNPVDAKKVHYPVGSLGYNKGGNRIMLSYGRQRAGIFCVGGVCRNVPASNGLTVSITSTF